jgi:undecaprenyl-diphosphatase
VRDSVTTVPADNTAHAAPFAPPRALGWWIAAACVVVIAAHIADPFVWRALRDPRVYERDWGRLLRIVGFVPTWLAVGWAVSAEERSARAPAAWRWRQSGVAIALASLVAGGVAELSKLAVRRLRPDPDVFEYTFRALTDRPWSTGGLGMPSSHTMVAFGAVAAASVRFPAARAPLYLLAIGCGVTRMLSLAHFASDVAVGAVLGVAIGLVIGRWGASSAPE